MRDMHGTISVVYMVLDLLSLKMGKYFQNKHWPLKSKSRKQKREKRRGNKQKRKRKPHRGQSKKSEISVLKARNVFVPREIGQNES